MKSCLGLRQLAAAAHAGSVDACAAAPALSPSCRAGDDEEIVREPSKVLVILAQDLQAARPRVEQIRDLYRARFSQESVLLVEQAACVTL